METAIILILASGWLLFSALLLRMLHDNEELERRLKSEEAHYDRLLEIARQAEKRLTTSGTDVY